MRIVKGLIAVALMAGVVPAAAEMSCERPASFINVVNLTETLSDKADISNLKASAVKARFLRRPICMAALQMSVRQPDCQTTYVTATLE